jgi:hypothetical protein
VACLAAVQIDRKQAGKNVLLHFIAPTHMLQGYTVQPIQLMAQPAARHSSFLGAMAIALSSSAHPTDTLRHHFALWRSEACRCAQRPAKACCEHAHVSSMQMDMVLPQVRLSMSLLLR